MIQFRGSNWGDALGRGIDTGMKIGGAVKQSMAESDYNSAIEKADADFDAASKAAEELKAAGDEKGYQSAMDTARRNQRYGRQQALAGYHKGMGNIGEADAANLKLEQMKFSDDFWGGIAKNSASLDKQMAERLSSDFFAQANGISYSLNDKNQLVTMQNGKPLGNPITITDEMRMPYLQKMYATEFDKRFGGAPTDASRTAWDTKSTALGKAIESNRKLDIEERKLDSYDKRTDAYTAGKSTKPKYTYKTLEGKDGVSGQYDEAGRLTGYDFNIPTDDGAVSIVTDRSVDTPERAAEIFNAAKEAGLRLETRAFGGKEETRAIVGNKAIVFSAIPEYLARLEKQKKSQNPSSEEQTKAEVQEPPQRAVPITIRSPMGSTMTVGPNRTFREIAEAGAKETEAYGRSHPLVGAYHKLDPRNKKDPPQALKGGATKPEKSPTKKQAIKTKHSRSDDEQNRKK